MPPPAAETAQEALDWLQSHGSKATLAGMARYAIPADRAFGVSVGNLQALAKRMGRSHDVALELWDSKWYEARMLAAYVDEPQAVTPRQMDQWCKEFDNWAICDTVCFALFDRTPHAWAKVPKWSGSNDEFVKRAAFALLWGLTVHDKTAADASFVQGLALVEQAARDERHFVKKAVDMALRAVGKRNAALNAAAVAVSRRLETSEHAAARWVGKHALKELSAAVVRKRIENK